MCRQPTFNIDDCIDQHEQYNLCMYVRNNESKQTVVKAFPSLSSINGEGPRIHVAICKAVQKDAQICLSISCSTLADIYTCGTDCSYGLWTALRINQALSCTQSAVTDHDPLQNELSVTR
jgi:uncharacterized protein (DUF1697 family)